MRFELANTPPGHLDGYLPMVELKDHNSDIKWEKESLEWPADNCKTQCLQHKNGIELISCEQLLPQDSNNMFG